MNCLARPRPSGAGPGTPRAGGAGAGPWLPLPAPASAERRVPGALPREGAGGGWPEGGRAPGPDGRLSWRGLAEGGQRRVGRVISSSHPASRPEGREVRVAVEPKSQPFPNSRPSPKGTGRWLLVQVFASFRGILEGNLETTNPQLFWVLVPTSTHDWTNDFGQVT